MTNLAIRKKLITYLADADDKKVKAVYTLLENDIEVKTNFKLSPAQLKQLNAEREKHIKGKSPSYTWDEVKENIRKRRKK